MTGLVFLFQKPHLNGCDQGKERTFSFLSAVRPGFFKLSGPPQQINPDQFFLFAQRLFPGKGQQGKFPKRCRALLPVCVIGCPDGLKIVFISVSGMNEIFDIRSLHACFTPAFDRTEQGMYIVFASDHLLKPLLKLRVRDAVIALFRDEAAVRAGKKPRSDCRSLRTMGTKIKIEGPAGAYRGKGESIEFPGAQRTGTGNLVIGGHGFFYYSPRSTPYPVFSEQISGTMHEYKTEREGICAIEIKSGKNYA